MDPRVTTAGPFLIGRSRLTMKFGTRPLRRSGPRLRTPACRESRVSVSSAALWGPITMPDRAIPCIKGDADHRGEKGAESACGNQRPSRPRGRVLRLVKQVCAVDGHGDRVTDSRTDDQRSTQLSNTNAARLLSAKVWALQASKHASPRESASWPRRPPSPGGAGPG